MDKSWSEKNKEIQQLLSKEATFKDAIQKLTELREELFQQITWIVEGYPEKAFYQMPFAGAKGYHSTTLAFSIWHIFRIEDIVAHEMIAEDEQILFREDHLKATASPIITTANELRGEETCEKGFFVPSNDGAAAARAQSLFVRKYGKKAFLKVQTRMHEKYDFQKVQEILGQDHKEALNILEKLNPAEEHTRG